jgi:hypothetical protein
MYKEKTWVEVGPIDWTDGPVNNEERDRLLGMETEG